MSTLRPNRINSKHFDYFCENTRENTIEHKPIGFFCWVLKFFVICKTRRKSQRTTAQAEAVLKSHFGKQKPIWNVRLWTYFNFIGFILFVDSYFIGEIKNNNKSISYFFLLSCSSERFDFGGYSTACGKYTTQLKLVSEKRNKKHRDKKKQLLRDFMVEQKWSKLIVYDTHVYLSCISNNFLLKSKRTECFFRSRMSACANAPAQVM